MPAVLQLTSELDTNSSDSVTVVSVVRLAAIPEGWGTTDVTWHYTYNFIWV